MIWWGVVIASGLAAAASAVWFMSKNGKIREGKLGEKSELPPGSMGWPFIGETLQYLSPSQSSNVGPFLHERISRYGDVFKTHVFGKPTIMTTSVEANQFVLLNEGRLFECAYPKSFVSILGKNNILASHGPMHLKLRKLAMSLMGTQNVTATLLQAVEKQVIESLDTWKEGNTIQMNEQTGKITFNVLMKQLLGLDSGSAEAQKLLNSYSQFTRGLFSFPIRIPGTPYTNSMKGREKALNALRNVITERKKEKRIVKEDFLDKVLGMAVEDKEHFNDEVALDILFSFLFAGYDTTSIAMTMAVKYLTETSRALNELREEHEAILREKKSRGEVYLTWEDYKSMTFTTNVITETLRVSNIGTYLFRECIEETKINGYRVPKGWRVVACTSPVNLDPSMHFEPLSFNPWRWEKRTCNKSDFQAFGGGIRYCLGSELAKIQIAVFLHHLVTKFRWEKAFGWKEAIIRRPRIIFKDGYPIYLTKRM